MGTVPHSCVSVVFPPLPSSINQQSTVVLSIHAAAHTPVEVHEIVEQNTRLSNTRCSDVPPAVCMLTWRLKGHQTNLVSHLPISTKLYATLPVTNPLCCFFALPPAETWAIRQSTESCFFLAAPCFTKPRLPLFCNTKGFAGHGLFRGPCRRGPGRPSRGTPPPPRPHGF